MKAGTPDWSASDMRLLRAMFARNRSDAEMAEVLGRSAHAVRQKRQDAGLLRGKRPRLPISRVARRCVELKQDFTASQIAQRLGITRNAVIGHWHRHHLRTTRVEQFAEAA